MDVAELRATLSAEIGGFQRNMAVADGTMASVRRAMGQLEVAAHNVGRALEAVKVPLANAAESERTLSTIKRSLGDVSDTALRTADHLADVKLGAAQAAETARNADSEVDSLKRVERQALQTRAATGGGGGGGGLGLGMRGAAIATGIGLAIPALPELAAATLGLGAAGAGGVGALAGGYGVLKLALDGVNKQAFTTQKAFDKLNASQQGLVQTLRSLDAGLKTTLEHIAQASIVPALTAGIHSAMTPSTVQALTATVRAFSGAVAEAARAWGTFLGGPFGTQLGQLLQHDAKYFTALNTEVMRGADIAVRFLNAMSPMVDWLNGVALNASKAADGWVKSARGMQQMSGIAQLAKQGLRDVGGLLNALLHDLEALSAATGSVNTLHLLTGALQEIANIINQNRNALRSFFAGVDQSTRDVLKAVHAIEPVIRVLISALGGVARQIGGWRTVIDFVVGVWLAKMTLAKLGVDAAKKSVWALAQQLAGIGPAAAAGAATADAELATVGAAADAATFSVLALQAALAGAIAGAAALAFAYSKGFTTPLPQDVGPTGAGGARYVSTGGHTYVQWGSRLTPAPSGASAITGNNSPRDPMRGAQAAATANAQAAAARAHAAAAAHHHAAASAFGVPAPFTGTGGGGHGGGSGAVPALTAPNTALAHAQQAFLAATSVGTTAKQHDAGATAYLAALEKIKATVSALHEANKKDLTVQRELVQIARDINTAKAAEARADKELAQAALAKKERGILGISAPGADTTASVISLRARAKAAAAEIVKASGDGLDVAPLKAQLAKIQAVLKNGFVPPDVRQAITSQFQAIKATIAQQLSDALADAKAQLAAAQSAFKSAFSQISNAVDAQFQAHVTAAVNAMQVLVSSPLGQFLFGGGITQTPAGQALSALQEAHTLQGLQDNLAAAQLAIKNAQTGNGNIYNAANGVTTALPGDPSSLLAAQKQLADAQYAITEHTLQAQDAIEQTAAQKQLADAQTAYQDQQRVVQEAMNQQTAAIEAGMEAGTITASTGFAELRQIWAANGIDLGGLSYAMGGSIYSGLVAGLSPIFAYLQSVIDALKKVAKLTGDAPPGGVVVGSDGSVNATTSGVNPDGSVTTGASPPVIPGAGLGGGGSLGGFLHATRMIPMAAGGMGRTKGPAAFFSAGNEDFAFSGEGKSFGGGDNGVVEVHVHNYVDGKQVSETVYRELLRKSKRNAGVLGLS